MGPEETLGSIEKSLASIASDVAHISNLLTDVVGYPPHAVEPEHVPPTDETPPIETPPSEGDTPPPTVEEPSLPPLPPPPTGVQ